MQLPQQVHQVVVRAEPVHQGTVAVVHGVPVLARHVLGPEEVALQAPGLVERLAPDADGVHHHADPAQVHLDQLAGFLIRLGVGRDHGDLLVGDQDHLGAVAGQPVAVQCVHQGGLLAPAEVEPHQAGAGVLVLLACLAVAGDAGEGRSRATAGRPRLPSETV